MTNISISKTASQRIIKETENQFKSQPQKTIPCLLYYHRSYSNLTDGRTVEHGSGLTFSFIDGKEAKGDQYLSVDLGDHFTLALGPAAFFSVGTHLIDWVDKRFTLASTH